MQLEIRAICFLSTTIKEESHIFLDYKSFITMIQSTVQTSNAWMMDEHRNIYIPDPKIKISNNLIIIIKDSLEPHSFISIDIQCPCDQCVGKKFELVPYLEECWLWLPSIFWRCKYAAAVPSFCRVLWSHSNILIIHFVRSRAECGCGYQSWRDESGEWRPLDAGMTVLK